MPKNEKESYSREVASEIFYKSTDKSIEVGGLFHNVGLEIATLPLGSPGKVQGAKGAFKFSKAAAKHMANPDRAVPVSILLDAIKYGKGVHDSAGSKALMYNIKMVKTDKQIYNLEVLYDVATNTIWHFKYFH